MGVVEVMANLYLTETTGKNALSRPWGFTTLLHIEAQEECYLDSKTELGPSWLLSSDPPLFASSPVQFLGSAELLPMRFGELSVEYIGIPRRNCYANSNNSCHTC